MGGIRFGFLAFCVLQGAHAFVGSRLSVRYFPESANVLKRIAESNNLKGSALTDVSLQVYDAQLWFSKLVDTELSSVTPVSVSLI